MKRSLASLAAILAFGGAIVGGSTYSASANTIVDTFTVTPEPIQAGQKATLDLVLTIIPIGKYTGGYFTDGTVKLFSGITGGPFEIFHISNHSPSPLEFKAEFTYPDAVPLVHRTTHSI